MEQKAEIGIFGGTGIYDSGLLQDAKEITDCRAPRRLASRVRPLPGRHNENR